MEKIRNKLAWKALLRSGHQNILTAELFERFKDRWDWRELIDRYDCNKLYDLAFLERYKDYIPASALQNSRLWSEFVEQRKRQIVSEITA